MNKILKTTIALLCLTVLAFADNRPLTIINGTIQQLPNGNGLALEVLHVATSSNLAAATASSMDVSGEASVGGAFALTGVITVTDTGTVNDYNPTGLASASLIIFNNAGQLTINGLAGGVSGRLITLCGINAAVNLAQENTGSIAGNRFNLLGSTNAALSVAGSNHPSCGQILYLGGTINRWTQPNLTSSQSMVPAYSFSAAPSFNAGINVQGSTQYSGTAHIRTATVSPPTVSSCGTGATVVGGDSMMTVTTGTGATGCTITFGSSAWGSNHPACIVYPEGGAAFPAISYSSVTSFALGSGTAASTSYDIHCLGTN